MTKQTTGLADQLRAAIRASGRSLTQLGETTGVDSGRLSRFMRGERDLTLEASTRLCETLGLELCPSADRGRRPARDLPATTPAARLGPVRQKPGARPRKVK